MKESWDYGEYIFYVLLSLGSAYDRAAIKFRGVEADINFRIEDYEEDMKQVKAKKITSKGTEDLVNIAVVPFYLASSFLFMPPCNLVVDEESDQRGVCLRTSPSKHGFSQRKLKISRSHLAQVWQMGG